MPARIRSRRISCSKAANTESNPAIARPVGVVRSSASVSDTKATPSSASSFQVTTRSMSDRPQRSSRHTSTTSISRRRAESRIFWRSAAFGRTGTNLFDLHRDRPTALCRILPHGAHLQRQSLLIVRGHPCVQPGAKHFRRFLALAKNLFDLAVSEARLAVTSRGPMRRALSYPFRPGRLHHITRRRAW
jgi:hypothetical protein